MAAAAAVCLVLVAFSWPVLTAHPRNVPVAVTGSPELVQQLRAGLQGSTAQAVEFRPVASRAAALDAIRHRRVVGAVVLVPPRPEVITASAAGSGPGQVLSRIAERLSTTLQQQAGAPAPATVRITDVVPLTEDDPSGTRLAVASLPLALGGVLGGALVSMALTARSRQLPAIGCYAALAGFGIAAILQYGYGALSGSYLLNGLAVFLALFGVAAVVLALRRWIGPAGIALAAVIFVLGANPISGATVPSEFLPQPWAAIGQAFPQGAGVTLLRDLSYFPDAATAGPWLVLAGWAAAGLVLAAVSRSSRQPGRLSPATTAAAPASR